MPSQSEPRPYTMYTGLILPVHGPQLILTLSHAIPVWTSAAHHGHFGHFDDQRWPLNLRGHRRSPVVFYGGICKLVLGGAPYLTAVLCDWGIRHSKHCHWAGLGQLHVQCNRLRLRLPLGSVITIMITQFSKVIEHDYDYMTKVIDYYSTIMITMKLVCV